MIRPFHKLDALDHYTAASERAASQIIASYSTSFGLATRLLGVRHRQHVRNVYALVRIADELVDGVTAEADFSVEKQHAALDYLEKETVHALDCGYSSNPVVHAFAKSAHEAGITTELTEPFFESMRTDLRSATLENSESSASPQNLQIFEAVDHARYVYGSAEVVGLMCLKIFVRDEHLSPGDHEKLINGARQLGAAFQNVNFLRDIKDDAARLGRSYLGTGAVLTESQKDEWLRIIAWQLDDARETLTLLPQDARTAVACALRLFSTLADRLAATPAEELMQRRVRVSAVQKVWMVVQSTVDTRWGKTA